MCFLCIAHVPDPGAPGVVPVSPGARAVTKSRRGGGEAAELAPPPTPHVKRNNLFILGFKNPSLLPALLGPSSLPSLFCALQPSPAGSALLLSSSPSPTSLSIPPLWPSLPSLLERGRGGGTGGALSAWRPCAAPGTAQRLQPCPLLRLRPPVRRVEESGSQSLLGSFSLTNRKLQTTDTLTFS